MAIERQLLYTLGAHGSDSIWTCAMRSPMKASGGPDAMQRSGYIGPAPVTLAEFIERVNLQKPTNERITMERVREAISRLCHRKKASWSRRGRR